MTHLERLEWLNEGAFLLMQVMNGRAIDKNSAEYAVFENWRKRGGIVEPKEVFDQDGGGAGPVS